MTKVSSREGKTSFCRYIVGLALVAVAVDSVAASVCNTAHGQSSGTNDGSIPRDDYVQKSVLGISVALVRVHNEVMKMCADRDEFFVYSSPSGLTIASCPHGDPTDAGSARNLAMEVEMKAGHQKAKKGIQPDSPAGAHPAIMFPKKSDEDLQNKESKPVKVHRDPSRPVPKTGSDNR
jgi:hypothetical protein